MRVNESWLGLYSRVDSGRRAVVTVRETEGWWPVSVPDVSVRDSLLSAGKRLFAELGYDQTTNEMIAEIARVPVESIAREFGDRRHLYLEVFRQAQAEDGALLERFAGMGSDRASYHRFLDAYLDHLYEHPENAALTVQRWMNDATDFHDVEADYVLPQVEAVGKILDGLFRDEVDSELLIWTLAWTSHLFVLAGIPRHDGSRNPADQVRFRRHLHVLTDLCLKP